MCGLRKHLSQRCAYGGACGDASGSLAISHSCDGPGAGLTPELAKLKNSIYADDELPDFFIECLADGSFFGNGQACGIWASLSFGQQYAIPDTNLLLAEIEGLDGQYPGLDLFAKWIEADAAKFTACVETIEQGDPENVCIGPGSWSEAALQAVPDGTRMGAQRQRVLLHLSG